MSTKLLYWVDVFTPKAYTHPDINNSIYLVVIPGMLIEAQDDKQKESSYQAVIDHLLTFNDPVADLTFSPIAGHPFVGGQQDEEIDFISLPLHPSVTIDTPGGRINHYNNLTGYSFGSVEEKLCYVINNYSSLPLHLLPENNYPTDDHKYLSKEQRTQYGNWLIALLTDLKKREEYGPAIPANSIKSKILEKQWHKQPDLVKKIEVEIDSELNRNTICVQLLELLSSYSHDDVLKEKELLPPAFQFSVEQLNKLGADKPALTLRIGTELNYNKIVANGFLSVNAKADQADSPNTKVVEQLRLYYGGGERVRVSGLAPGFNYMHVADDLAPTGFDDNIAIKLLPLLGCSPPQLTLTNNYSLLGHVFNIPLDGVGPADIDNVIAQLSLKLNGQELFNGDSYANDLRVQIKAAYLNVTKNTPLSFLRDINIDAGTPAGQPDIKAKGKVFYYPVNSVGIKDGALNSGHLSKQFFLLPELLLDEMEEAPRVTYYDANSDVFIDFPPQRKFFQLTDIWDEGIKNDAGGYIYPPIKNSGLLPGVTLRVLVRSVKLADGKVIYKISKKRAGFCIKDDEDRFFKLLDSTVYTPGVSFECWLGYAKKGPQGTSEYKLINIRIAPGITRDADELLELYTEYDLRDVIGSDGAVTAKEADLVLISVSGSVNTAFWNCFNLLTAPSLDAAGNALVVDPPFIALKERFKYKFNISVNGFTTNLETRLRKDTGFKPSGLVTGAHAMEPVDTDYRNFNKLRVYLNDGQQKIKINDADALLPEYESYVGTNGTPPWSFWYSLTHRFSETTSGTGTRNEQEEQEEARYQLYKTGGKPLSLQGWIEHQYAYRLGIKASQNVSLGYSGPIHHMGQLLLLRTAEEKRIERLAAAYSKEELKTDGKKSIEDRAAADSKEEIPALFFNIEKGSKKITVTLNGKYTKYLHAQKSLQYYREFYEALYDLKINSSRLKFIVEEWNFNNRFNPLPPADAAHPELARQFPSILHHLDKIKSTSYNITIGNALNNLFAATFTDLKKAIESIGEIPILEITLNEVLTGDITRVGIEITREAAATVMNQFLVAGTIDPAPADLIPTPFSEGPDKVSENAFSSPAGALAGLKNVLDPTTEHNELYRSFAFIYSKDHLCGFKPNNNINEILGETAKYVAFPTTMVTNTNIKTYYVPYSFVPLKNATWPNSELATQAEQYEFVNYLLRVLAWLAYPDAQKGSITDLIKLNWETDAPGKLQAFHVRSRVRDEFLRGIQGDKNTAIAWKLASLLNYTDNDANVTPNSDHETVRNIRSAIDPALRSSFSSMFTADPASYINLKAIGVGLFSNMRADQTGAGRFDDLYSFKVDKQISEKITDLKKDTTHFNFRSLLEDKPTGYTYYLDQLSDELYDNEFTISDKVNEGIEGRTAENVLENNCNYGGQCDEKSKMLIKPYCDNWRSDGKNFYLLPSRKPPVVPIEVTLTEGEKTLVKTKMNIEDWKIALKALNEPYVLASVSPPPSTPHPINEEEELKFKAIPNGLAYYKASATDPGKAFNRYDSYISQYYFLLDADEESEINNDTFEIIIGNTNSAEVLNIVDNKVLPSADVLLKLEKQFKYHTRKHEEGETEPSDDISDLVNINEPYTEVSGLHQALLDLLQPDEKDRYVDENNDSVFELKPTGNKWGLKKTRGQTTAQAMPGDIIATNLLKYENPTWLNAKYIIKIMVLANPWAQYRCSMRVRRNERDFDDNGVPDLNPAFQMRSAYSSRTDHGIKLLSYNYLDVADPATWDDDLKYLRSDLTVEGYKQSRHLKALISTILSKPDHFSGEVLTHRFSQLISNRPGYTLIPYFHPARSVDSIRSWGTNYGDKIDLVQFDARDNDGSNAYPDDVHVVDAVLNPVPENVLGLAPFVKMVWYHPLEKDQPVFSINWQVRFKQ